jgi:hypothetical protein
MPRAIKKRASKKDIGSEVEITSVLENMKETLKKKQKMVLTYGVIAMSAVLVLAVIIYYQHTADKQSREIESRAYNVYYNLYQKKSMSKQEQYRALDLFKGHSKQNLRGCFYI